MSTSIYYKDQLLEEFESGTRTLKTAGKYLEADVILETSSAPAPVEALPNDVEFIDYDGRIVASYSASEFLDLQSFPPLPSHTRLTSVMWSDAYLEFSQDYVRKYGGTVIGALYDTVSGMSEFDLELDYTCTVSMYVYPGSSGCTVSWGDGSSQNVSGTASYSRRSITHTYQSTGTFTISISGNYYLNSENGRMIYSEDHMGGPQTDPIIARIKRAFLVPESTAGGRRYIGDSVLAYCRGLESVTISPNFLRVGSKFLYGCISLKSVSFRFFEEGPSTVSDILSGCASLQRIANGVDTSWFTVSASNNPLLRRLILPNTLLNSLDSVANDDTYLRILHLPDYDDQRIFNSFNNCTALVEVHVHANTPPEIGNCFNGVGGGNAVFYVPYESLMNYQNDPNWSSFNLQGE